LLYYRAKFECLNKHIRQLFNSKMVQNPLGY